MSTRALPAKSVLGLHVVADGELGYHEIVFVHGPRVLGRIINVNGIAPAPQADGDPRPPTVAD